MTEDLSPWFKWARQRLQETIPEASGSVTLHPRVHENAAFVLDADGDNAVAQFIMWPSGAIEATVLAVSSEQPVHCAHLPDGGDKDLEFQLFLAALRGAEQEGD